jgi:hypothetical protein
MDYCEGGDLYNKIHSMRGVFVPEDQVSNKINNNKLLKNMRQFMNWRSLAIGLVFDTTKALIQTILQLSSFFPRVYSLN